MKRVSVVLFVFIVINIFLSTQNCDAQWTQSNGPYTGAIKSLLVSGSTIFAGVDGAGTYEAKSNLPGYFSWGSWEYTGLYTSADNGQNWSSVSPNSGLRYLNVKALAEINPGIFAGTDSGVFRSIDNGVSWVETSSGITNKKIKTLFAHGLNLYAGTATGIFLSTVSGSFWSAVNNGLTYQDVYGFTSIGSNVYVGTNGGVFMTTNNGSNWTSAGISNLYVFAIASIGNNLFAGTLGAGVYVSTNNGTNWTSINNGLLNYNIYTFGVSGTNLYAGTEGGTFFTSNNGTSWTNPGITDQFVKTISVNGGGVFSGTETGGVFKSTNNGANWLKSSKGLYSISVNTFEKFGNNLFCGNSKGVFLSTDNGLHWERRNTGFGINGINGLDVTGFYNKNEVLFASVYGVYRSVGFCGGVFKSTNNGLQWYSTYHVGDSLYQLMLYGINGIGNNLYVPMKSNGTYASSNDGYSWRYAFSYPKHPLPIISNGTYLFTADQGYDYWPLIGIIKFNGSSGGSINGNLSAKIWHSLAVEGNTLFAGTDTGRIYKSTNLGVNWVSASNGIPNTADVTSLAISGQNIFAGTSSGHGLYVSKDGGNTWATKNDGLDFPVSISSIYVSGNDVLIGTTNQSVWRSTLSEILGVQNISSEVPSGYSLGQNYPNPFNPISNVKFSIINSGDVKLVVYDIMGREVQTLVNEILQAGTYEVKFDGSMLPSGVYFYKLSVGDFSETKRMTLIK